VSPPPDPKAHRYDGLSHALVFSLLLAALLSIASLLLSGEASEALGAGLVAVLVATPLLRVLWFVQRWLRRGDVRFALVGVGVLGVVAIGALLATLV
jgi:hypothetical protein